MHRYLTHNKSCIRQAREFYTKVAVTCHSYIFFKDLLFRS